MSQLFCSSSVSSLPPSQFVESLMTLVLLVCCEVVHEFLMVSFWLLHKCFIPMPLLKKRVPLDVFISLPLSSASP